ncbi:Phospho-N-acetylmuramoyl-pentapeptide-transferase [Candidatus Burarchaeum australiense]|nr:Phospho-N-acetylmuramoyl-pentapeptide-transferase [Candidatus Burarchaeum australiense]
MNLDFDTTAVLVAFISFAIVALSTKWLIRKMTWLKFVDKDMNKRDQPLVPKMGGISIVLGFVLAVLLSLQLSSQINAVLMLAAINTVVLIAFLGLVDDIMNLRDRYRVILPIFAALPLMVVKAGTSTIGVPFFGEVNFNLGTIYLPFLGPFEANLYILLLIPLGVVASSNLINLLGGFNGLEVGIGAIVSATLAIAVLLMGFPAASPEALFLATAMFGACAGFLIYNWYPAKIFPGNITTYALGATVAAAVIIGNMERIGVIVLSPQIIEFFLKARSGFQAENFGKVGKDGRLSYDGPIHSLTHLTMKLFRPTEQQLVLYHIALQAIAGNAELGSIYI